MRSLRGLLMVTATLFVVSQSSGITIRFPNDSLLFGIRNTDRSVQIQVDSVSPSDSLISVQLLLVCDTNKIRFTGIGTDGTLSSGTKFLLTDGHYERVGYKITLVTDGQSSSLIVGSGALVTVTYQILDDSAGVVPICFDSAYTELAIIKSSGINRLGTVAGITVCGSIVFSPTANVRVDSTRISYSKDTLVEVPVILSGQRGDGIRSMRMRFRSDSRNVVFKQVNVSGSLLGKYGNGGGWWQDSVSDSGKVMTIIAQSDTGTISWIDSLELCRLIVLVRDTDDVRGTVFIDSLILNGFEEPFKTSTVNGGFFADYSAPVSVFEESATRWPKPVVYPNPANSSTTLSWNGDEIQRFELFDEGGRLVLDNGVAKGSKMTVNTAALRTGLYLVRMRNAKKSGSASILVAH